MHVCAYIHTYTHWILWVGEYLIGGLRLRVTARWGTVVDSTPGPIRAVIFVFESWLQMPSTCDWNSQSNCVCLFIRTRVHVHSTVLVLSQRTTWRSWFSSSTMYVLEVQLRLDGEGLYLPRSLSFVLSVPIQWADDGGLCELTGWADDTAFQEWCLKHFQCPWRNSVVQPLCWALLLDAISFSQQTSSLSSARLGKGALN